MPATISASGTWTGITFDSTNAARTKANVPTLDSQRLDGIAQANAPWSELQQFIQLVATNYSIGWRHALVLVKQGLTAMLNRSDLPGTDTYIP